MRLSENYVDIIAVIVCILAPALYHRIRDQLYPPEVVSEVEQLARQRIQRAKQVGDWVVDNSIKATEESLRQVTGGYSFFNIFLDGERQKAQPFPEQQAQFIRWATYREHYLKQLPPSFKPDPVGFRISSGPVRTKWGVVLDQYSEHVFVGTIEEEKDLDYFFDIQYTDDFADATGQYEVPKNWPGMDDFQKQYIGSLKEKTSSMTWGDRQSRISPCHMYSDSGTVFSLCDVHRWDAMPSDQAPSQLPGRLQCWTEKREKDLDPEFLLAHPEFKDDAYNVVNRDYEQRQSCILELPDSILVVGQEADISFLITNTFVHAEPESNRGEWNLGKQILAGATVPEVVEIMGKFVAENGGLPEGETFSRGMY